MLNPKRLFAAGLVLLAVLMPMDRIPAQLLSPLYIASLALLLQLPLRLLWQRGLNLGGYGTYSIALLLPAIWTVAAASLAVMPNLAWGLVYLLGLLLLRSWLVATFTDQRQLRWFEQTTLAVAALVAGFGYYQFLADVTGWAPAWLQQNYTSSGSYIFPRVHSTAQEPLYLAHYLFLPLGILLSRFARAAAKKAEAVLFVATLALFITTVARGAYIALLIAGLLMAAAVRRRDWLLRVGGLSMIALLLAFAMVKIPGYLKQQDSLASFTSHAADTDDSSVVSRYLLWSRGVGAIKAHPVTGYGPGGTKAYLETQGHSDWVQDSFNNDYITLLAEQGLVAALFYLPLVSLLLAAIVASWWRRFAGHAGPYAFAFGAMAIQAATFSSILLLRTWVVIGLLLAAYRIDRATAATTA